MNAEILSVKGLVSGYRTEQVLHGIDAAVSPGEIVALIGHNGAGKSTLLKAIFGLAPIWQGELRFDGVVLSRPTPRASLMAGVAYAPQANGVFRDLTVRENLEVAGFVLTDRRKLKAAIDRAVQVFPDLTRKWHQLAGSLSGGEKQMLALAGVLVLSPRLLLLDEPSLGLASPLVRRTFETIRRAKAESHAAILIVEQKVKEVLRIADRVYILRNGHVSWAGLASELSDQVLRKQYL